MRLRLGWLGQLGREQANIHTFTYNELVPARQVVSWLGEIRKMGARGNVWQRIVMSGATPGSGIDRPALADTIAIESTSYSAGRNGVTLA